MKLSLKKIFTKKKAQSEPEETAGPQESYTTMNSNSLYSLPSNELVGIIFKFDTEVKNLHKELASTKEQLSSAKNDLVQFQGQSALYKQHNETLQQECNKLAIDLNETQTLLSSKQAQLDLLNNQLASREELIENYKTQIRSLEKHNLDLQITGISLSPDDEIYKLKAKLEENNKSLAEITELRVRNKMLEGEIGKLSSALTEDKEQIRIWKEQTNLFEQARKELENQLNNKNKEFEGMNSEIARIRFLQDSNETEIRALKESLAQKDVAISKKTGRIQSLEGDIVELKQKILRAEHELNDTKARYLDEISACEARFEAEKLRVDSECYLKTKSLEENLQSLSHTQTAYETLQQDLQKLQKNNKDLQDVLTNTLTDLHQKSIKNSLLEEELAKLTGNLAKSDSKRELARTEILKLTQKLESISLKQPQTHESFQSSSNLSDSEVNLLQLLRSELESLYKTLMKIIAADDKNAYRIQVEDFTSFEKRLNNIVMQLHEQLDEISEEKSWTSRSLANLPRPANKGRTPIKLFSCITDQEEAPRLIPKPKKPVVQADNRLVLRRGSAN